VELVALVLTMSGPNTASNRTASHMTAIAIAAHISRTSSWLGRRRLCGASLDGSCAIVDIQTPSLAVNGRLRRGVVHQWFTRM
jgi:hypothetical protein